MSDTVNTGPTWSAHHPLSLHPECPDVRQLGPTDGDAQIRARATAVSSHTDDREEQWSRGFSRRRLLAGGLGVGVASLASQLVTTRVAYAAPGSTNTGVLIVVFLRGGMDGLSVLVPSEDPNLLAARPTIAVRSRSLIPFARGFGLHPALAPLRPLITSGKFAAVPALATPQLTRSHFQAQTCLEQGGSVNRDGRGWLDRVLEQHGPGTTFRGLAAGPRTPVSMTGTQGALGVQNIDRFDLRGWENVRDKTMDALRSLYTGLDHPLGPRALTALDAVDTASSVSAFGARTKGAAYPDTKFAKSLRDVALTIKSNVGLRVACIDVGGWDMHTAHGTVDNGDMQLLLREVAEGLAAFNNDLGSRMSNTTIVTMSEFGRRLKENASGGTDHGHGGVALVMGGGVRGGVHGTWNGLGENILSEGDVPGSNDYRNVLGEVVNYRLGLSDGALAKVFPGHRRQRVGIMG